MATGSVHQAATGNQNVDGLLSSFKWNSTSVLYNFPTSASYYPANYNGNNNEPAGFVAVSESFKTMVRLALNQFSAVSNLTFTEVSATATSNVSVARTSSLDGTTGFSGYGYYPGSAARTGDVWFDDTFAQVGDTQVIGRGTWRLVMHELGHAMGLKHAHETDTYGAVPTAFDYGDYTLMSYRRYEGGPDSESGNEAFGNPQTLMMLDMAALQAMYGANYNTNSGDTTYAWSPTTGQMFINGVGQTAPGANRIYMTLWDGNGNDTYDLSSYGNAVSIDLRPGQSSVFSDAQLAITKTAAPQIKAHGNVFNALLFNNDARALIENATGGSGNDTITGNSAGNILDGKGGADIMSGLDGNDQYFVDNAGDVIIEGSGNGAFDRIFTSTSYTLADTLEIEMVSTTGHFGTTAINITGNFRSEFIIGNDGDNIIDGGGGLDTLWGRSGNDQYIVRDAGAVVFDDAGFDRIFATTSYVLGGNDSIEMITTTDHFGTTAINLSGNFRAEYIIGNDGANIIDGGGGADTLWGRAGNDQYIVNDGGAVVQEETGTGVDRVFAGVSYTLGDGAAVEIFTTTDHSATAAINLTGNWRAEYILGNAGANIINGGQGGDTLGGFGGADKFLFNTTLGASNVDAIEDFVPADDSFWLDNAVFTGLPDGVLSEGAFRISTAAVDADDRIIYNSSSGNVFFDADGVGGTGAVQFAHITPGTGLVFNSFLVI